MERKYRIAVAAILSLSAFGCRSPYYADRGAAVGGLTGAGVGALIGNQLGETGAGAAIGAGVGALTGAAVGQSLDDIEARNRAQIEAQLGRQVAAGAASIDEVIAMHRAGVDPQLITSYVRNSGVTVPINASDVINLHQQGVPTEVIQAMQTPSPRPIRTVSAPPGPVIVQEHYYDHGPPCAYPPHFYYHGHRHAYHRRPHFGWGFSVTH